MTLRPRDVGTALFGALWLQEVVPARWDPAPAVGDAWQHPPLFGFPLPYTWWSGVSSLEFAVAPLALTVDLVAVGAVIALGLVAVRAWWSPRRQLTWLSLALLWAWLALPAAPYLVIPTPLEWSLLPPVQAELVGVSLGATSG